MLPDPTLTEITRRIVAQVQPTKIFLFGSRARGDNRPDSDYDLVLIYDGEKNKRQVKIESRRSCRDVDASIDILTLTSEELNRYRKVANTLEREITENGVVIYG